MRNREQIFDKVAESPRYPAIDWTEIGRVAELWIPEDGKHCTVGWLISQGADRLAFTPSNVPRDSTARIIQDDVWETLRDGAAAGRPRDEVWDQILTDWLHKTPADQYLPALMADIHVR
ncbi:hypothetical protein [Arthrobacter sp. 7Tela_A1]|uniref:hypothetical protein n=1 Tax=Arthrobacter sp. 7Tela_A1 TaxID=3093745 RepID=UPI003BB4EBFA